MSIHEPILARVEQYLVARNISETTFGLRAVQDATFVARLREGRVTLRIAQKAIDFIDDAVSAAEAAE